MMPVCVCVVPSPSPSPSRGGIFTFFSLTCYIFTEGTSNRPRHTTLYVYHTFNKQQKANLTVLKEGRY